MTKINSKQIKIAKRYARALAKLPECESVLDELNLVEYTLLSSSGLKPFLENPLYSNEDKKDIIEKVFKGISAYTGHFLMFLIDKRRFNCFEAILCEFKNQIDVIKNIIHVDVVSPVELTEDEKIRLNDCLKNKLNGKIEAEYFNDESIVAGLVVKIGDKVIDNSLKARFEDIKKQLIK